MQKKQDILTNNKPVPIEAVKLYYEGKILNNLGEIYEYKGRYFVVIQQIIQSLGGSCEIGDKSMKLLVKGKNINVDADSGPYRIIYFDKDFYISLFYLATLFHLHTMWDHEKKSIFLYPAVEVKKHTRCFLRRRPALLRLEDVTASPQYTKAENLFKLRAIADYLSEESVPFHIAWISRYMDPPLGIDNDLLNVHTMENAEFLFSLEYMMQKGALIGLHGYTHQYGDEVSGIGTEMSKDHYQDEVSLNSRIKAAIDTAKELEIAYVFFESPHYAATANQQSIIEKSFDIIYEAYVGIWNQWPMKSPRNHKTVYVPTPLDYLPEDKGAEVMDQRINKLRRKQIASLFYHPYREFDFIKITTLENGTYRFEYDQNSPLHVIVRAMKKHGCRFKKVTEMNHFVKR